MKPNFGLAAINLIGIGLRAPADQPAAQNG
jgi:hypothetical protein